MIRLVCLAALLGLFNFLDQATGADEPKGKRDPEAIFKKLDSNGDGKLNKEEFAKFVERMAKLGDKGKSEKDKPEGKPEGKGMLFEKLDADKNGFLSLEEFKKFPDVIGHLKKKSEKN